MLVNTNSAAASTAFEHHSLNPGSLALDWTPVPFSSISDALEWFSVFCPSPEPATNWDKLYP